MLEEPMSDDSKQRILVRRLKPERNLWREDEILTMLRIFRDNNYVELLSDKNTKSENVFRGMEDQMAAYGYSKKNFQQIWTKWKFLKSTYMTSRRANVIPKVITTKTYLALDNLLNSTFNQYCALQSFPDSESFYDNNSETSLGSNNNSISVNNNQQPPSQQAQSLPDPRFMEHPIFGSRLEDDYVKSEPLDIDEFNQQMQEDEEDEEEENHEEEQPSVPSNNRESRSAMAALGLMPVCTEIFPIQKSVDPVNATQKSQVPRLKTVPLRKISLKQPEQPIPIAPISTNNTANIPRLVPKPTIQLTSSMANQQQKLPKLKLSIKPPTLKQVYEAHHENDQPPAKSQKFYEGSSASETPSLKSKSMKDLANNLKDMQKDLIAEFFKKQQELITEEFAFQRRQDEILLKSFEDQNRVLLTAAKNMIEQIPSNLYL